MQKKNSYHTSLKLAYSLGLEKQIVPKYIKDFIPKSTYKSWRQLNPNQFIGQEIMSDIAKHLSFTQEVANYSTHFERSIFSTYLRLKIMIVECIGKQAFQKLLFLNKTKVINAIEKAQKYLALNKILKFLNLKDKTFYHWRTIVKYKCDHSAIFLCTKRHPNQATFQEVNTLKTLLNSDYLSHWPIASIWGYAIKNNLLTLSLASWYHYNKLLKLRKTYWIGKKPVNRNPIFTNAINEVWHADITIYKTADQTKCYIYTVMDNFSRKILNWKIAYNVNAAIRLATIKEAIHTVATNTNTIRLVTDGGPENDNHTIKDFIQNCSLSIHHEIAMKDILSSNSPIEASYKTLKRYLRTINISSKADLMQHLKFFFHDYNEVRPHYALGIFTPSEIYEGATPGNPYADAYPIAAQKRREVNRNANCATCK
jgi:transposase InsO family protein